MESWVKTAREKVSKFLCLETLSDRFHELKDVLQAARCTVILDSDTLGPLDESIDEFFYNACKLAFESRDLVQLFESKCERALLDVGTIMRHLKAGQIEPAYYRLESLHEMSLSMQKKSAEMVNKFLSFSKDAREITKKMREEAIGDTDALNDRLSNIDSLLKKSMMELNEHKKMKEKAIKELKEKKLAMSPDKEGIEYYLKLFNSISFNILSIFEMKAEIHHSDFKEEERSVRQGVEALEITSKKYDSTADELKWQAKQRSVVKDYIDTFVCCMEKSVKLMNSLQITVDDMCSFWNYLEECFGTTTEQTDLALKNIGRDSDKNKFFLKYPGVEESMQNFEAFWKALQEVCTESKAELKKVAEGLKSAYMKVLSPEEAKSYVQINFSTD